MKVTEKELQEMDEFEYALYLEYLIYNELGAEKLAAELLRAIGTYDLIDYLEYIARMHDIELPKKGVINNEN